MQAFRKDFLRDDEQELDGELFDIVIVSHSLLFKVL